MGYERTISFSHPITKKMYLAFKFNSIVFKINIALFLTHTQA